MTDTTSMFEWRETETLMAELWPKADLTDAQLLVMETELKPLAQPRLREAMKKAYFENPAFKNPKSKTILDLYRKLAPKRAEIHDEREMRAALDVEHKAAVQHLMTLDEGSRLYLWNEANRRFGEFGLGISGKPPSDPGQWTRQQCFMVLAMSDWKAPEAA